MSLGEAVLLGIVQGITEFLPISSKTHLVVVPALLGLPSPGLPFIVLLHLGTLLALLAYFARDLVGIVSDLLTPGAEGRRTASLLAVATVPAAIAGYLWEETFERLLSDPVSVAFSLVATAALLATAEWVAGRIGRSKAPPRPLRHATLPRDALGMGVAQAVALLPGVSRSGSTMAAGLGLGLHRAAAARFSFLMAIPVIAGANALELPEVLEAGVGGAELAGFAAAFGSGLVAVTWLLRLLHRATFLPFAVYCLVFALVAGASLV